MELKTMSRMVQINVINGRYILNFGGLFKIDGWSIGIFLELCRVVLLCSLRNSLVGLFFGER